MVVGVLIISMLVAGFATVLLVLLTEITWAAALLVYSVGGAVIALVVTALTALIADIRAQRSLERNLQLSHRARGRRAASEDPAA